MKYSPQAFALRSRSRAMDACEPCQAGNRAALSGTTCAARAPVRSGCLRRVFHGVFSFYSPPRVRLLTGLPARPRPLYLHGASPAPNPGVLFPRRKSTQKCASLRLERLQCCFIDATAGLCDGYRRCTPVATAVMVRLPECLALSPYPSFGLEAYCLIHMKYGCETHLALLWIPRFVSNQTAASNKSKGRQPK